MSAPQTHPLILTAAGAVILASGVGIASWLGWIGSPKSTEQIASAPVALVASAPVTAIPTLEPTPSPTPVPTLAPAPTAKPKPRPRPTAVPPPRAEQPVYVPAPTKVVCNSCGRVVDVQAIQTAGQASGGGAVVGGVLGGVVGHQVGKGRGNDVATVLGAIGGAVAGHQVEKQVRKTTSYDVRVVFDDGSERSFSYQEKPQFSAGDRVRLRDGQLTFD
ncbi:hypothetical protein IGB42_01616 [Andreprevotia sp. IGB-42]|uniref:glycine zipper 2TM domain-containing protein n=1 Tax=Andreprevotia sp. IGB-42 TaxID=2497473 RepID=UPI001359B27F|nr:glycine zipper 2TM domain-containing protein [Andreprevotia sp. IGB-42]KAF0813937.1 hypothetical protein IGB42_01616 [Andreprevotia sp. IGB-42]